MNCCWLEGRDEIVIENKWWGIEGKQIIEKRERIWSLGSKGKANAKAKAER